MFLHYKLVIEEQNVATSELAIEEQNVATLELGVGESRFDETNIQCNLKLGMVIMSSPFKFNYIHTFHHLMEGVGFVFEFFFIAIPKKKLVLFTILTFCYVILFLRFRVRVFY
jgi:hypothetical protein